MAIVFSGFLLHFPIEKCGRKLKKWRCWCYWFLVRRSLGLINSAVMVAVTIVIRTGASVGNSGTIHTLVSVSLMLAVHVVK